MSGGTPVTLSADEIVMDPNAVHGPVDPQIGDMAAASIVRVPYVPFRRTASQPAAHRIPTAPASAGRH
jgi:ClpP class serine protease